MISSLFRPAALIPSSELARALPGPRADDWAQRRLATVRVRARIAPVEVTRTDRTLSREQVASMTHAEIATALGHPDLYAMAETVIAAAF